MSKIIAIIQARTDSTRLPKKVLRPLLDTPMIIHQLQRVSRCKALDKIVLATSDQASDDTLANVVQENGFTCYRGAKEDVLGRFYHLGKELDLTDEDIIMRLTGDCPLQDPAILDELITLFKKEPVDYAANCINPVYPDGFDAEIFSFKALRQAFNEAKKLSEREHVTPYIHGSGHFKVRHLHKKSDHVYLRLTVDEDEDFLLIEKIYEHFGHNRFTYEEIIRYLSKQEALTHQNAHIKRNEGYEKSLLKDKDTDDITK